MTDEGSDWKLGKGVSCPLDDAGVEYVERRCTVALICRPPTGYADDKGGDLVYSFYPVA